MTTASVLERLDYGSSSGCAAVGLHRDVISGVGATRTLLQGESGALCLFDAAAGNVFTLPTPVVGMQFEFITSVSVTSNSHKIITSAATVFLLGEALMCTTATASPAGFAFNGTTHVACTSNGTTTGGLIGSRIKVTAISTTQWLIEGTMVGSGTIVTPAATS